MNFGKWMYLFFATAGIGIAASLVIGTGVFLVNPEIGVSKMGVQGIGYNLINTAIVGALLGVFSHMGFFAYLTVNYFAQGIFRNKLLWSYVQVFLIAAVTFYSVVLRVPEGGSAAPFLALPFVVLLCAIPVTWRKVKQTNRSSLIPTLFFMTAVTLLEAVPALRQTNAYATALMVGPLFLCNAFQILQLHRVVTPAQAKQPANGTS